MGLDIIGCHALRALRGTDDPESGILITGAAEWSEQFMGLSEGRYVPIQPAYSFRAGSYTGYNEWRDRLSRTILGVPAGSVWNDADRYRASPFFLLINFTDCDGALGPLACYRLFEEFCCHRSKVLGAFDREHSLRVYDDFLTAFAIARHVGAVIFR